VKPLDKLSTDYERKMRQRKKREEATGDAGPSTSSRPLPGKKGKVPSRRFGGKPVGRVKNELKTVDQIRKSRNVAENKRAKNARPGRGSGKGRR